MVRGEWSGSTLIITWTPLTLHEARGFPFYIVYIDEEKYANTTESSILVTGLDTSKSYTVQVEVRTRFLNPLEMGVFSNEGMLHVIRFSYFVSRAGVYKFSHKFQIFLFYSKLRITLLCIHLFSS